MKIISLISLVGLAFIYISLLGIGQNQKKSNVLPIKKVMKTEKEWRIELTEEQYYILRKKGTERAFSGEFWNLQEEGVYSCAGCGNDLFHSESKFKSGTGWPSFFRPFAKHSINEIKDNSYGWERIEVVCSICEGHLGHVFKDGPKPSGLRYCINSASLTFKKKE